MFTIGYIAEILRPIEQQLNTPKAEVLQFCFDSRKSIQPAVSLFFAIRTHRQDGHVYIDSLAHQGVTNFIVTDDIAKYKHLNCCNFIRVANAVEAMQQIAACHRAQFSYPVVGITGSNGKTIVKEWLAAMLADDYNIIKNPNSYNSQIGVPFSVWQMNKYHNFGIFEAGISQVGEMENLAKIIQPTIGILTNIGEMHSRFFRSDQEKMEEKLKLFAHAQTLIYCCDYMPLHQTLQENAYRHLTKISWGKHQDATYRITNIDIAATETKITLNQNIFAIPFIDAASIENAMHAIALLLFWGFSPLAINRKLRQLQPVSMRLEIKEAINQSVLINDTYSLDINSLRIAVDLLHSQSACRRKTVILSDFEQATPDYKEVTDLLIKKKIDRLLAIGEQWRQNQQLFHLPEQHFFASTSELIQQLPDIDFYQDAILIKGARNFQFERIVDRLQCRTHKTILQINLSAIVNNLNYYRSLLHPQTKIAVMAKAFCYGLGDIELINELIYNNIDYLAVAFADEGIWLRQRQIQTPIIVLGAEAHSFEMMIKWGLEPEIFNFHYLQQLIKILSYYPEIETFKIHLKFDTGMHRLGFSCQDVDKLMTIVNNAPQLRVASLFSHIAAAEDPTEDAFTLQQIALFKQICHQIVPQLPVPALCHVLNSAGISRFAADAQCDMVRLGLGLYGYSYVNKDLPHLQDPVMLKTVITQLKEINAGESVGYNRSFIAKNKMILALIPIGYADGLHRELSNGVGKVLVKGKFAPIVGKICMDMCMIDVTGLAVTEGEEAIVYGKGNPLNKVADSIHKTSYELLTSISRRVPRIYVME